MYRLLSRFWKGNKGGCIILLGTVTVSKANIKTPIARWLWCGRGDKQMEFNHMPVSSYVNRGYDKVIHSATFYAWGNLSHWWYNLHKCMHASIFTSLQTSGERMSCFIDCVWKKMIWRKAQLNIYLVSCSQVNSIQISKTLNVKCITDGRKWWDYICNLLVWMSLSEDLKSTNLQIKSDRLRGHHN